MENYSILEFNMTNSTDNATAMGETEIETLSKKVMFWSLSLIIPMGFLFNIISVPVFMSKPLQRRSASWYLAALGIADTVTLLTCCLDYWMKDPHIGIPVTKVHPVLCILVTHLSCASRLFSAVLITSFTVERFICVVAPLKRAALSKPGRARRVIAAQCILCIIFTSFVQFTMGIKEGLEGREAECDVRPDRYEIYFIFTAIFLLFGSIVIPIIVIFTLNTFIMKKVCMRRTSLAIQNVNLIHNGLASRVRRRSFNTASILLTVSTSFVILNIPYCISFLLLFFQVSGVLKLGSQATGNLFAAKYFSSVPYYLNYCINFLLYNVCARAFRVEMRRLMCYICRVYEDKTSKKRSPTLSRGRPTISDKLTPDSRTTRKMCNQFFAVPHCNGHCIRPETTSFTSDPVYPINVFNMEIHKEKHCGNN